MARRVFLHIGAPKSGTTFLQSVLWANKQALSSRGLLVPGIDQFDAFYSTMTIREVRREKGLPGRAADAWTRLVGEVAAWSGDAIISHEFFAAASAAQALRARAALEPAEVHLVMTVRSYVTQVPALWQESVKVGSTATFEEFVEGMLAGRKRGPLGWGATDVEAVLERWTPELPAERVHVVTVPPAGSPPDLLWRRFCLVLGVDPDEWEMPSTRRNQSLGAVEVELLRRVNPHLRAPLGRAGAPHYRWVRRYLAEDILVSRGGQRFGVDASAADVLRERSEAAVVYLSRRGFDVVGDTNDLLPGSPPPPSADAAEVSTDELLDAALETIAELVDRHRRSARGGTPRSRRSPPGDTRGSARRRLPLGRRDEM
jgi:hypothetical protein